MSKVPKFFKSNPERGLALILGVVILSLGVVFIALAWTEPSATPPEGDVAAPINVSNTGQAKAGKLGVQTDVSGTGYDGGYGLSVGDASVSNDGLKVSGSIHLDSNIGDNNITGVNKITVNTVDPIYKIEEKKYATYMPDEVGQMARVTGEDELEGDKRTINLANQPEGADLWLFWQMVDRESIKPFVSPQGPASLYAYMEGSNLIVEKIEGDNNIEFSLQLTGTRIDHADKTNNLAPDQEAKTYIIPKEERK